MNAVPFEARESLRAVLSPIVTLNYLINTAFDKSIVGIPHGGSDVID
jgi:hypothetical protein